MLLCKTRWGRLVTTLIWLAIGLALPVVYGNGVEKLGQLDYVLSLVMVGIGLNIVLGFAGQIFLGPSALFAAGGYASAVAATHYTGAQNIYAMCLISVVVSVILAAVIAALTLRVGGFYLGMVTLFIALVIPVVAGQWSLTGGQSGLSLLTILTFTQKPSGYALYVVGVGIVAVMAGFAWAVRTSRLGRRFGSIMASEDLATSIGVAPYWTKLASFLLAAIPIGIAGGYYVYSQQFISPDSVTVQTSIYILAGLVVGGAGTILGPIIGVALIGVAIELLNSFNQYEGLVYGVVLILVAILMPTGIMGVLRALLARFRPSAMAPPSLEELAAKSDGAEAALPQALAPAETDAPPLVVTGARRRFGGVMAVDGVDLTVERGKIHALVGPNGSGKTTLLNLITGYYSLDGGSIAVGDKRLDTLNGTVPVSRMGIARTFQTPKLNQFETALGNVFAGADRTSLGPLLGTLFHTPRARRDDRQAMAASFVALGEVGLVTNAFDMAGLIPHGTQRLLEIARAMALRPMFVLLDEPAAGLSPAEAEVFKDAVRMMARAGLGVLIVEHNLPIVFDIADEVTVLDEGQVIATGTPAEVSRDPIVVRVYIGRQRLDRPGGDGSTTATLAPGTT
jgi:ABC-type branched-subunit amino acid transport system ATPase component/ABC-type branched-subunit amino acid transport system permease subunit